MNEKSPILFAYGLDGKGGARKLEGASVSLGIHAKELAWVHLDMNYPQTREWLEREAGCIDKIIINALLADETRPRLMEYEQGALLILRGVNLNPGAEPEDMVSIRIWADPHRIISLQRRALKAALDIEEALLESRGPRTCGDFVTYLCNRIVERMDPVLSELDERCDTVEEQVMSSPDGKLRGETIAIRLEAIGLRRYISPLRDVMAQLRACSLPWLDRNHKRHLEESREKLQRYVENLDAIRERAQVVKDELAHTLAETLNRNTYLVSVITAIFMPLTFVTGLLGSNIAGIPGATHPQAFWMLSSILASIILLEIAIFKKLKWL